MGQEVVNHNVEVVSMPNNQRCSPNNSKRSAGYLTSTPIKKDSTQNDDDVVIVKYVTPPSAHNLTCQKSLYISHHIKKEMSFETSLSKSTVEQCLKLKREIRRCYKRMSFRVDEMLQENSKPQDNSESEYKIRRRSSSRSRRSKGTASPEHTTPVRRSSRLLKAKNDAKMLTDENNNGIIKESDNNIDNTLSASFLHAPLNVTVHMKRWVRRHPFIDLMAPFIIFMLFAALMFFVVKHFIAEEIRVEITNRLHNFGLHAYGRIQTLME